MEKTLIEAEKAKIDKMSREQMCELWRFAPVGHPYFQIGTELTEYFMMKYRASGGMSPEISKKIGR